MSVHRTVRLLVISAVVSCVALPAFAAEQPVKVPDHYVAAIYFHRTQRCPTCRKISAYIDEAIHSAFAKQLKAKTVMFTLMDYQDPKNAKFTRGYKVKSPILVIADVRNGKVVQWKPMRSVWTLVGKKAEFFKYVQDGVRGYSTGG